MSDTPITIVHNGQTCNKLQDNSDVQESDIVMISGKLFDVTFIDRAPYKPALSVKLSELWFPPLSEIRPIVQAIYRKCEPERFKWFDKETTNCRIMKLDDDLLRVVERYLTSKYGSPEALKKQGVREWLGQFDTNSLKQNLDEQYYGEMIHHLVRMALLEIEVVQ